MSDHAVVAELAAKQAITEVIYRYCRALDRMDLDMAATIWHPDGTADYGPTMFQGTGAGFIAWVWEQHTAMQSHSHQISNVLIEVDGDRAASEAYVTAALRTESGPDAPIEIVSRGRYVDQWSRREADWAIDHRVLRRRLHHVRRGHERGAGSRRHRSAAQRPGPFVYRAATISSPPGEASPHRLVA